MHPLTLDDLLPLPEFAGRRREFFTAHARYLDRYRRVRVGPDVTLVFENRQTLWFRVQEVLRICRLAEPALVQQELDVYNRLLPGPGRLQAALLIDGPANGGWETLRGDELGLRLGSARVPAVLLTCRPEDRSLGAAHWVQFDLAGEARRLLANYDVPACFDVSRPDYRHESPPLSDDARRSLLEDLGAAEAA